jgi:hypothetical protein
MIFRNIVQKIYSRSLLERSWSRRRERFIITSYSIALTTLSVVKT